MEFRIKNLEEYEKAYQKSVDHPEVFWGEIASHYDWIEPWKKVLTWNFEQPDIRWFEGGKTNITYNCLDRHLKTRGNKLALIWEPNDPKEKFVRLTFRELHERVCQYANVLKRHSVKKAIVFVYICRWCPNWP